MTSSNLRFSVTVRCLHSTSRCPLHPKSSTVRQTPSFLQRTDRGSVRALNVDFIDELDAQLRHRLEGSFDREADPQSPSAYEQSTAVAEMRLELEDKFNKQQSSAVIERQALERDWSSQIGAEPIKGTRTRREMRPRTRQETHRLLPETPTTLDQLPNEGPAREELENLILQRLELQILIRSDQTDSKQPPGEFKQLPLLTKDQEVVLGTIIQRATPLLEKQKELKKELHRSPTFEELSKAMEMPIERISKLIGARQRARGLMIQYNIRLVLYCAHAYRGSCPDRQRGDLISEGMGPKGLGRAADLFDPTLGVRFSTYATIWIRRVMADCFDNEVRTWTVPRHVRKVVSKMYESLNKLANKQNGGRVSIKAIAEDLDLPVEKLQKCLDAYKDPVSLESVKQRGLKGDVTEGLIESIPDPTPRQDPLKMESIETSVNLALSTLEPRERNVLKMRYGLGTNNGQKQTLAEIGKIYNLSLERVRQIEEKAKRKLRKFWRRLLLDPDNIQLQN